MINIFLVLVIPYMEFIFRNATTRCFELSSVLISLFYAISFGAFFAFILRISRSPVVNRILTVVYLSLIPLLFYVEFLIYRSFKVFYDINTCVNGAGGAITGFWDDIMRLVFCPDGILVLLLLFAPLVFYLLYLWSKDICLKSNKAAYIELMISFIVCYSISTIIVFSNDIHRNLNTSEYNYQTAVEKYGFLDGLRLDIKYIILGKERDVTFESFDSSLMVKSDELSTPTATTSAVPSSTPSMATPTTAPTPTPTPYGYNEFDIDFDALAETTSGTNAELDKYVASLKPSRQNEYTGKFKGKNLIFITAEAFSGDVVDPELTPTLYRLINKGIQFTDYYQPSIAGTTGGEYSNLFSLLPTSGGKSFQIITEDNTFLTMGSQLSKEGYYGKAYHNNTHTIYSRNVTHNKLGYSDGFMGVGNGMEEYIKGSGFPESDLEMMQGTFPTYVIKQPFNVYYMSVSGHGQYGRSINQMSSKNYERVADLDCSEQLKCYIACQIELEDALAYLVGELEKAGIEDETVICLSPDHFPYGLDNDASLGNMPYLSELYGYNVLNYLQRDHNKCILWCGELEDEDPIIIDSPTSSLDLLPTLSNLFGVPFDSRLFAGRDVFSDEEALVFDGAYDWKTDLGTYIASGNTFTPVSEDTVIPDGYVDSIKAIVRNKFAFCKGVLKDKYYSHVYDAYMAGEQK